MLERAATTGLEPAKFQQLLSRSALSSSHKARSHTRNFSYQHPVLLKESPQPYKTTSTAQKAKKHQQAQLRDRSESSSLLEFLYPRPTHTLLHPAFSPKGPHNRAVKLGSTASHRFSSSTASTESETVATQPASEKVHDPPTASPPEKITNNPSRWKSEEELPLKDIYGTLDGQSKNITIDHLAQLAEEESRDARDAAGTGTQPSLERLLEDFEGELYQEVWDMYCHLPEHEKPMIRPRIVAYLSKSRSVVEAGRSTSLLRQVEIEFWDNDFLSAVVLTYLRSGDQSAALKVWNRGFEARGLTGGFEYLLIDYTNRQQWEALIQLWIHYCKHAKPTTEPFDEGSQNITDAEASAISPDLNLLSPLASLPSLGALYFSFERYLAKLEMFKNRQFHTDTASKTALRMFRRRFAEEALGQPCPPKQASVILDFWRDASLYNTYLTIMFDKWYKREASPSTARMLPEMYEKLRALDGAIAEPSVLRGIFKVHYPHNVAELEQLRHDWVRFHGDLSHWAFEKFLKFYAHRGDVQTVFNLWNRYVEQYPSRLKTPRGFRSTINVYAQNGDIAGIENEFRRMTDEYKVTPDIDTWNMIIKCYVRADDYHKVLSTFEEISTYLQPSSFTYAHVMTMAAKKGDLEVVLTHFDAAQQSGVEVSREMGLALVLAYCKNDQLVEAEEICKELAHRGVSSTEIWNQLLHYSGMHGRLSKCYELLTEMKKFGLDWDQRTITYLLRALVQVNEIFPAYQVVRDASKNKLHVLVPEHFGIVMLGAVKSNNRTVAEGLVTLMDKSKISMPFNTKVAYARAAMQTAPNAMRTPKLVKDVLVSLQELAMGNNNEGDIRRRRQETAGVARAVQLLVECRDFDSVESLLSTVEEMFPQFQDRVTVREDIVTSLMLAYHRDENYARVHELWEQCWPRILSRSLKPDKTSIYPAHEYDITRIMFRMVETFSAEEDGDGLLAVVTETTTYGFKYTSSTWDRIIRSLARLGHWERAMEWCEKLLMPQWQGWKIRRKPRPDARRRNLNTRILRPRPYAIMALQQEWLEIRKLAAWSSDVSRKLDDIANRYPRLHYAFTTSKYMDQGSPWVFRGDVDPLKAMAQMLTHLPIQELRFMERELEKHLDNSLTEEDASPFRRAEGEFGSSKALQHEELTQLRGVLRRTLREKGSGLALAKAKAKDAVRTNVKGSARAAAEAATASRMG